MPDYKPLFVVAAGLAQAVGTVLFVAGLTSKRRYLERKDLEVSVVPAPLGRGAYGLGVIGAFERAYASSIAAPRWLRGARVPSGATPAIWRRP